jgi:hypothetical protein
MATGARAGVEAEYAATTRGAEENWLSLLARDSTDGAGRLTADGRSAATRVTVRREEWRRLLVGTSAVEIDVCIRRGWLFGSAAAARQSSVVHHSRIGLPHSTADSADAA